jgi:trimethylamine--corrinoid protein Co-methyltransferase
MNFFGRTLSDEEINQIHNDSLRILAEVGVKYYGEMTPKILNKYGIKVDCDEKIAKIPAEIINQTLEWAPKSFMLGARNPEYNFDLPSPTTRYCIDGTSAFALDFYSGERRYGTRKDIENALQVFQRMDMGIMAWAPTCASDTPAHVRALYEFFSMACYSSKHGQHELHRVEQVPYLVAGLKAILGSEDAIRSNNWYSLIYCPVAPLMHDGQMLDAYLMLGDYGLPVMVMPMPVTGTTGPASLFSNIALANAEALSSIVIFELAHPGRPLIYASATGTIDFRSGAYLAGVPEMGLQSAALTEMAKYYHLPCGSAGCTSDAKQPGPEAVIEKIITTLPSVLVGADIIVGLGEIESDQTLILEQIVVDNEIAHMCRRIAEGVDCQEEKQLYGDIAQVGVGGHFLGSKSTRIAARSSEFYTPRLIDRHAYEAWVELGRPSMYFKAREMVTEILAEPLVDPLPEDIMKQLDDILLNAEKEIRA